MYDLFIKYPFNKEVWLRLYSIDIIESIDDLYLIYKYKYKNEDFKRFIILQQSLALLQISTYLP
jgi:hypothetical protein